MKNIELKEPKRTYLQRAFDWLNADGKNEYAALFRHALFLIAFAALMLLSAIFILKTAGV